MPIFIFASEELEKLVTACNSNDWDTIYKGLISFNLPSLPVVRGSNDIPEIKAAKDIYDSIKKNGIEDLNKLFYDDSNFISSQFKKLYEPIRLLAKILNQLTDRIFNAYLEENTFTFHNTESLALKLLCSENDGEIAISEEGKEFLNLFDEVCVDEYQDTNDL